MREANKKKKKRNKKRKIDYERVRREAKNKKK